MYEQFYGFSGKPFQLSPDPRFFFSSAGHKRAMAYMRYGLQQEQGFIIVTGDVGTGKSMLVSHLFSSLDDERLVAAKIVSTNVQSTDLIRLICAELGIAHERKAKASLLNSLEERFRESVEAGKQVLLVIDEAQNLPRDSLEELRMLSNFEYQAKPLVQSFLLGQREFRGMLRAPGLEQLRQRVIAAYHLGPLTEKEIASYVRHRLKVVGWVNDPELEDGIFQSVYDATGGIPRRINTFFDRLLLTHFLDESHLITSESVVRVAGEIELEIRGPDIETTPEPEAASARETGQSSTVEDNQIRLRLERMEKQLTSMSTLINDLARTQQPLGAPVESKIEDKNVPRWTMAFALLSAVLVTGISLAGYFVFLR